MAAPMGDERSWDLRLVEWLQRSASHPHRRNDPTQFLLLYSWVAVLLLVSAIASASTLSIIYFAVYLLIVGVQYVRLRAKAKKADDGATGT